MSDGDTAELPYGRLDRALHRLAFASRDMQRALGEIETRMFRDRIDPGHAERPVFVTSLPRAGTTVLMTALAGLPEFATATYRQMPFPLSPMLWSRLTGRMRREGRLQERAHGDGVAVGFDSPEAFEEPLWMAFWPERYGADAVALWSAEDDSDEFAAFLRTHMAKIVAADGGGARRYLSKNNANIARLPLLARLFPDAGIVVPIRDPWSQTASLLRQHRRFVGLHAREPFGRRYMEWLGHFEFGAALRPLAFPSERRPAEWGPPGEIAFWLAYWCDAYEHVLANSGEAVILLDHDRLCREPEGQLAALAERLRIDEPARLVTAAESFRPPRETPKPDAPAELLDRAERILAALRERAVRSGDAPAGVASSA